MTIDKRKHPRRVVHYPASIETAREAALLRCTVCDISDSGAKLNIAGAADLPGTFQLLLSGQGGIRRQCRVMWRRETQVGVRFEKAAAPPAGPKRVTVSRRATA